LITNFTQFAAESAENGIGALGVDGKALIVQLLTFLLAFFVLKRFAFKPILAVLQKRRELIESGVELGEQMKREKAELEKSLAEKLQAARVQADGIIAGAEDTGKQVVRDAEEKARQKADGILKEADSRIASETARARKQLEGELVGLISDATEAIIGEKVDTKKDAQLIDAALKGSKA
jgi:F-type H+-transporting ATPase subunit b